MDWMDQPPLTTACSGRFETMIMMLGNLAIFVASAAVAAGLANFVWQKWTRGPVHHRPAE